MSREVIFVATRAGLIGIGAIAIVRATITDAIMGHSCITPELAP
jgi:hypothetical protein